MTLDERRVLEPPREPPPMPQLSFRQMPWVSPGLIGVCVIVFFAHSRSTELPPLALYGPAVFAGEWWRIFGHVLEHGGIAHLAMNMYAVWGLGVPLERLIGSPRFLAISIVGCLGAATLALAVDFDVPTVGASGMILGWAGTMLPLLNVEGRRMLWRGMLLPTAAITVLPLLARLFGQSGFPMISWAGHLGGFVAGIPCGFALRARRFFYPAMFSLSLVLLLIAIVVSRFLGASA